MGGDGTHECAGGAGRKMEGHHGDWGRESVSEGIYAAAVKMGGYSSVRI